MAHRTELATVDLANKYRSVEHPLCAHAVVCRSCLSALSMQCLVDHSPAGWRPTRRKILGPLSDPHPLVRLVTLSVANRPPCMFPPLQQNKASMCR